MPGYTAKITSVADGQKISRARVWARAHQRTVTYGQGFDFGYLDIPILYTVY